MDGRARPPDRRGRAATRSSSRQEMYGEYFDIPTPDELVFISSFDGGEVFRSGCCLHARARAGLLLQPRRPGVPRLPPPRWQRVIANAVRVGGAGSRASRVVRRRAPRCGAWSSARGSSGRSGRASWSASPEDRDRRLGGRWTARRSASRRGTNCGWVGVAVGHRTSRRLLASLGAGFVVNVTAPEAHPREVTLGARGHGRVRADREAAGDLDGRTRARWSRLRRPPGGYLMVSQNRRYMPTLLASRDAVAGLGTLASLTCDFYIAPPRACE